MMWRTPEAGDSCNRVFAVNSRGEPKLSEQAQLWPTPTSGRCDQLMSESQKARNSLNLAQTVQVRAGLWPTPKSRDFRCASGKEKRKSPDLNIVAKLWPTQSTGAGLCGGSGSYKQLKRLEAEGHITEAERRSMSQGNGGQLNPDWVSLLMGLPVWWTDIDIESEKCEKGVLSDGAEARKSEILRELRDDAVEEAIQWTIGRFPSVSKEETLLAILCEYEERSQGGHMPLERASFCRGAMRSLWHK